MKTTIIILVIIAIVAIALFKIYHIGKKKIIEEKAEEIIEKKAEEIRQTNRSYFAKLRRYNGKNRFVKTGRNTTAWQWPEQQKGGIFNYKRK